MAAFYWIPTIPFYNLSKNPINAKLKVFPWGNNEQEVNTRILLKVTIEKGLYSGDWEDSPEISLYPDANGDVETNLQYILDAALDYFVPDPNENYFQIAPNQSCRFIVKARLIDDYQQTQAGNYGTSLNLCIKGGIARKEGQSDFYITEGALQPKPNLGYTNNGLGMHVDDERWLTLIVNQSFLKSYTVKTTYTYLEDGNNVPVIYTADQSEAIVGWGNVVLIPYGIKQMGFPEDVVSLTVKVTLITTDNHTEIDWYEETFSQINHRIAYEPVYLYFHNSLGAFCTQRMIGSRELIGDYEKQSITKINTQIFSSRNVLKGDDRMYNSTERAQFSGETGFISREQLFHLRDLLKAERCYTQHPTKRLIPLNIQPDKTSIYKTDDELYSLALKWEQAYADPNYNDDKTLLPTCPYPIFIKTTQSKGEFADLYWKLPDGYFKAEVTWKTSLVTASPGPGYTPPAPRTKIVYGNEGTTILECDPPFVSAPGYPEAAEVTIDMRVICKTGPPMIKGPVMTIISYIYKLKPIYANNGFATTYKGAGIRTLTWQTGSDNIFSLVDWNVVINQIDVKYAYLGTGNQLLSCVGSAGGIFQLALIALGINLPFFYEVKYTPPSADFTGVDIADYKAKEKIGTLQTAYSSGKLYVKVEGEGDNGNGLIGLPYIRLELSSLQYQKSGDPAATYQQGILRFYLDPLGTIPVDVTGTGLSITLSSYAAMDPYPNGQSFPQYDVIVDNPAGTNATTDGLLVKLLIGSSIDFVPVIMPSSTYVVIP